MKFNSNSGQYELIRNERVVATLWSKKGEYYLEYDDDLSDHDATICRNKQDELNK